VVLASGRGSNFAALLAAEKNQTIGSASVSALVVNRPGCGALKHATEAGIPTATVDHKAFSSREAFETELLQAVQVHQPDALVLAGFMRILTPVFLTGIKVPIINLHPALLPAFPGARALDDAFEAQVRISGCTTHLVTAEVDAGPILMQGVVPLLPADDLSTFAQRMHAMEHRLLPATVAAFAQGDLRWTGEAVQTAPGFQPCLVN